MKADNLVSSIIKAPSRVLFYALAVLLFVFSSQSTVFAGHREVEAESNFGRLEHSCELTATPGRYCEEIKLANLLKEIEK